MDIDAAVMDMEEALRTLEMVGNRSEKTDLWMYVESERAGAIAGESERVFADLKSRMEVRGYYISGGATSDSANSQARARRQYSSLRVVRLTDATTSSLMSLFSSNDSLTVELTKYKAGGDVSKDLQPSFKIKIEKARIKTFTILSGEEVSSSSAVEIIEFAFRKISIDSAPQLLSGLRGAVRTFTDLISDGA